MTSKKSRGGAQSRPQDGDPAVTNAGARSFRHHGYVKPARRSCSHIALSERGGLHRHRGLSNNTGGAGTKTRRPL